MSSLLIRKIFSRERLISCVCSNETVGIIFKIEPEAFRILDQTGAVRVLRPSQIGNKLDTRMSVATDKDNYELRAGDMVRETVIGVSTFSHAARLFAGTRTKPHTTLLEPRAKNRSSTPRMAFHVCFPTQSRYS